MLTKYKIAIFVDGEFFHGKGLGYFKKRDLKRVTIVSTGLTRYPAIKSGMMR